MMRRKISLTVFWKQLEIIFFDVSIHIWRIFSIKRALDINFFLIPIAQFPFLGYSFFLIFNK
jgi:hypothetical protein